jgi:hypothetical protein
MVTKSQIIHFPMGNSRGKIIILTSRVKMAIATRHITVNKIVMDIQLVLFFSFLNLNIFKLYTVYTLAGP